MICWSLQAAITKFEVRVWVNFDGFNYSDAHDGDVELTTIEKWKTTKTKNDNVNIHKHRWIYAWKGRNAINGSDVIDKEYSFTRKGEKTIFSCMFD